MLPCNILDFQKHTAFITTSMPKKLAMLHPDFPYPNQWAGGRWRFVSTSLETRSRITKSILCPKCKKINGDPVFWGSSNIYWYFLLLLTWPTPFWGRKTQQVHRFFGNMSMDLQARHLTCAPILRVPQVTSIDYIHLWFIRNIILYLRKPNSEQKCQASHPPPRYMLLVRNS